MREDSRKDSRKVRRRLADYRSKLINSEKNLATVIAANRSGRTSGGVVSPGMMPTPTKASPNMVPWSDEEVAALREAIAEYGPGQWKVMFDKYKGRFHPLRNRFNLRDRYKQLKAKKLW